MLSQVTQFKKSYQTKSPASFPKLSTRRWTQKERCMVGDNQAVRRYLSEAEDFIMFSALRRQSFGWVSMIAGKNQVDLKGVSK